MDEKGNITLTSYRVSTNYQVPGQRVQYACTRPNGQKYTAIEVVSGQYAWDEDVVGAELLSGRGKATPTPAAPGAIAKATLNAQNMAERVEVGQGAVVTEFTYADYADYNNPLNKVDAFYAGTLVEKRNGVTARDLTTAETETGNVYVVMPVPASVRTAAPTLR